MKNRITLPTGMRVIVQDIVSYTSWPESAQVEDFPLSISLRDRSDEVAIFKTEQERDAFLARLDNYFQEIA